MVTQSSWLLAAQLFCSSECCEDVEGIGQFHYNSADTVPAPLILKIIIQSQLLPNLNYRPNAGNGDGRYKREIQEGQADSRVAILYKPKIKCSSVLHFRVI